MRSGSSPDSSASDVPVGTGISSGRCDTLRPIPTTAAGPSGVSTRSTRMPATFRSPSSTSLGHLTAAAAYPRLRSVLATVCPVRSGSHGQLVAGTVGRSRTEKTSEERGGASQVRSRRPRPAVWCSATTTVPSGAPSRARSVATALVDGTLSTTSTARSGASPESSAASSDGRRIGAAVTGTRLAYGPHLGQ